MNTSFYFMCTTMFFSNSCCVRYRSSPLMCNQNLDPSTLSVCTLCKKDNSHVYARPRRNREEKRRNDHSTYGSVTPWRSLFTLRNKNNALKP